MYRGLTGLLGVAMLLGPGSSAAQEDALIGVKRLSLAYAQRIGSAAIEACREQGVQVAVTVVDRAGQVQLVMRDVLAMELTLEVSRRKAYTALSFGSVTSELATRGASGLARMPNVAFLAGGVPVRAGGAIVAGIGVSGAPSGETDEACASAGLEAVAEDLEFAGE